MSLCIVTGIHTSGLRNATNGPKKPGSATPITVRVAPPTISSLPTIARIAIEAAQPVRIADHHHGIGARCRVVARLDQAPHPRALPQHLEKFA